MASKSRESPWVCASGLKVSDTLVDVVIGLIDAAEHFLLSGPVEDWRDALESKDLGGPAHVQLKQLSNIHPARHAEWIQKDVNWSAVLKEWHVFLRNDPGDNALISVTTSHLVTDRDLPLVGEVDLDHFQHAALEFVTTLHVSEAAFLLFLHGHDARPELRFGP